MHFQIQPVPNASSSSSSVVTTTSWTGLTINGSCSDTVSETLPACTANGKWSDDSPYNATHVQNFTVTVDEEGMQPVWNMTGNLNGITVNGSVFDVVCEFTCR